MCLEENFHKKAECYHGEIGEFITTLKRGAFPPSIPHNYRTVASPVHSQCIE